MAGSYEMNMTSGPLLGKILTFSFPLMCSGVLQLLFNAADIIVVGRYTGHTALAAVGSTSSLINLIVNLFVGLSVGANVLIARSYGAKNMDAVHKGVHTAMLTAVVGGVFLIFVGVAASRPMLSLMGTPDDVIDQAALYLRIYFVGAPSLLVYNFGAAILRAVGDTRRPLYFLTLAGIINVVLNLVFVIVFSLLFWHKRPRRLDLIACAVVFGGVLFFFVDSLEMGGGLGNFLALLSGVSYAGVFLMNDMPDSDALSSVFWGEVLSSVTGLPFLLQETEFPPTAILSLVVLGVFQVALAYILLAIGLKTTPPVMASLVSGIEPVLNPILVAVFYQEYMGPFALVGAAVVIVGVVGYNVIQARQTAKSHS